MMGPDYTHWHGTYEVAKNFYAEFIPALEEIVEKNLRSGDPRRVEQADKLKAKIEEVLASDDHKWFINKMDPEEMKKTPGGAEGFPETVRQIARQPATLFLPNA